MLIELVYRIAVEDTPPIQHMQERHHHDHLTLEVDGRDMMVDLCNYRKRMKANDFQD
jgi:hypothetical protein